MSIQIQLQDLERKIEQAFKETALQFSVELTKVISEAGAFPDFPDDDIVDTGALRASQLVLFPQALLAQYIWGVGYALYVHEGYTLRNGQRQIGRPWTWAALTNFNWEQRFAENLARLL